MNGDHARLLELKRDNDGLRRDMAAHILKTRELADRLKAISDELRELTQGE